MRIGYPCINLGLACRNKTFRLASYSEARLIETVKNNLDCLYEILTNNLDRGILFFRINSDLIPFASHPVCRYDWAGAFKAELRRIGWFVKRSRMRIGMHPDQFTLLNSVDAGIFERSLWDLAYHARVLDEMGLDITAKIQIHVGGVYGDKENSMARFVARFAGLQPAIRRRLAIENDHHSYSLSDCMKIHERTGIPVVLDAFHHQILSSGETLKAALARAASTWNKADGPLMVDYSSAKENSKRWAHAESIRLDDFRAFLQITRPWDFDLMLEIKDKEASAIVALRAASRDRRLLKVKR
jgi:UV DNA damage endonuclease